MLSDLNQLEYDENGRLAGHVFAYPTGECAQLIEGDGSIHDGMWRHKFVQLSGQAYAEVFGHLEGGSKTVPDNVAHSISVTPAQESDQWAPFKIGRHHAQEPIMEEITQHGLANAG